MSFASPWLLLSLLAVPLAVAGHALLERRRTTRAESWASAALMPNMVTGNPGRRRYIPLALFLLGLTLLLVGFARPEAKITTPREGATVVLALDVSGSMAAKDVKPTRLLAARASVLQFLEDLPDKYRVSLVLFSSTAVVRVPPTYDRDKVARALPTKARPVGTSLARGIGASVTVAERAIGKTDPTAAAVLLLSDGAQTVNQGDPAEEAAKAKKFGIHVSTVSLGTPEGVVVHKIPGGEERIDVPVAPGPLRELARTTGGTFFQARSAEQLQQVYKDLGSQLVKETKKREVTVVAAGAALAFLLAGALLSGLWFRRLV